MRGKRKVLIFIDWFLPGYKAGGPIQSCANLVEHLKEDYEFYIATRNTDYCSEKTYTSITSDDWNSTDLGKCYYFSKKGLNYSSIKKLIEEIAPDIIYINGIYSLYFSILPLIASKSLKHKHILVAGRGMFAKSAINVKGYKKIVFLQLSRVFSLYKEVVFHATNKFEANDINDAIGKSNRIIIAPNLSKKIIPNVVTPKVKEVDELKLVSIARVSPEKNLKYALEVLAGMNVSGTITFDIYGPIYNELYWQECKVILSKMPPNIKINYKGSLESNWVVSTLFNYHVLFMPTKGENFGHIILESLMAACSVLISNQTPWKNLQKEGIGYDLALTDINGFRSALTELLRLNQEEFNLLSNKAYNFALQYIQNSDNLEANKLLFK